MDEGFTHPPELRAEIAERIPEYEIGLSWHQYHDREEEFLADLSDLLEARRELMWYLIETEEWELFFFVYTEPDRLQHLIWDEDVILEHYQELDDILGEVIEYIEDRDANLFVVSDHGFGPIRRYVHVNTVLESEGLLQRRASTGSRDIFHRMGITKSNVRSVLRTIQLEEFLLKSLPDSIINSFATSIPGEHRLFDVEFGTTMGFAHTTNIYVNDSDRFDDGPVSPANRKEIKQEIRYVLEDIIDPETWDRIIEVHDGSELFPTDSKAPDLVAHAIEGYEVSSDLSESVITDSGGKAAGHRPDGIFLARGPNIGPERDVIAATVYDIVPTIMHSLGKPIPDRTDGSVLDIFEPGSSPATSDIKTKRYNFENTSSELEEEFEQVEERLKGLGYLN